MEKLRVIFKKTVDWITEKRNLLFLVACFIIHAVYAGVFFLMDINTLALLNIFSCCFYFYYLVIKRDTSEKSMLATYFEILLFSVLSELALGPDYGFYLYIIGMSATIFYIIPSYVYKRFLYQFIGIVIVLFLEGTIIIADISFPDIQAAAKPYNSVIFLANIAITASLVLTAAFFYSKELDIVWNKLKYNTNHDALTGLYNRRFLESKIQQFLKEKNTNFVICMIDIDFFKKINDTYGHKAGDMVLTNVSACLSHTAGNDNFAVRWGGEEFIIYFPNMEQYEAYLIMERLRKQVEGMITEADGEKIRVTITAGIAAGTPNSNYEKVIKRADEKLYVGKQQGRNQIVV